MMVVIFVYIFIKGKKMSTIYGEERNIEKSAIDTIRIILIANRYKKVTVVKSFKQANKTKLDYELKNAIICVKVNRTTHKGIEIGSYLTQRRVLIVIDIFGTSDGQIKDLKDCLISNLKSGINYYEYTVREGETSDAIYESGVEIDGRLIVDVENIIDNEINLGEDKASIDPQDRYRWQIILPCFKSKVEV